MFEVLCDYYENYYNEDVRLKKDKAHSIEFLTTVRYFDKLFPSGAKVLDACAGTGVYSFYLAQRGYNVTAGDLVPYNVQQIKKKEKTLQKLDYVYTGSVLDLSRFPDASFDVVLCMGAFYHLMDEALRKKAVLECLRVLKKDGILVASYINLHASILRNCEDKLSNIDELLEYSKTGIKSIFYRCKPSEIEQLMIGLGLTQLYNIGTD